MNYNATLYQLALISITHFPIDYVKARGITPKYFGEKKALYIDQVIHYVILAIVFK
ncbi:hypothetical protein GCM10008914_02500 [Clostridium tertium]|nr:hypothetical protein [Clostridium tertium]